MTSDTRRQRQKKRRVVRKRREKEEVWERNTEDGKRHHWLQRADGEEAPVAQSGSRVRCRSVDWAQKHGPYLGGGVDGDHLGWAVRLSRATTRGIHPFRCWQSL